MFDVLNLNTGEQFRLQSSECEFGYRESIFKHRYAQGYVITAVGLKLAKKLATNFKIWLISEF